MKKQLLSALAVGSVAFGAAAAEAQQSPMENLSIHGYLTQGYGRADIPIHGIPNDGTADLRTAALQLRYALSPQDNFVVQARHRRLGDNLLSETEEDVQLQWAFYQRRMGGFSLRVGKVPLPMGLYSEVRNVGTILPFYRAPVSIYPEGVETFDGVNLNYDLLLGPWTLEASTNFGSFNMVNVFPDELGTPEAIRTRGDIKRNAMLTVNTPIPGLRLRGTYNQFEQPSFFMPDERETTTYRLGSLEGNFTLFNVRGEYGRLGLGDDMTIDLYYVQGGVRPHSRVALNTQYEVSKIEMEIPGMGSLSQTSLQDFAVGVNYFLAPNVVMKVEGHRATGFSFDNQPLDAPKRTGDYLVTSLSVSF